MYGTIPVIENMCAWGRVEIMSVRISVRFVYVYVCKNVFMLMCICLSMCV